MAAAGLAVHAVCLGDAGVPDHPGAALAAAAQFRRRSARIAAPATGPLGEHSAGAGGERRLGPRAFTPSGASSDRSFKVYILISLLLAAGSSLLQAPSLAQLLRDDHTLLSSTGGNHLYALIFVLVLLHALHVIGGIVPLTIVTVKGFGGAYDHEHSLPVQHTAMYWHFLDAVWIVMFSTFQLIG